MLAAAATNTCFRLQPLLRENRYVLNSDVALYLRTSDFRRIGVLDEDWVRWLASFP